MINKEKRNQSINYDEKNVIKTCILFTWFQQSVYLHIESTNIDGACLKTLKKEKIMKEFLIQIRSQVNQDQLCYHGSNQLWLSINL